MNNISIKKAAIINAGAKYSNVIFMLIANAILARILSPEDYGILAMISVFVTFFNLFSDMGLGTGVIQNKELTESDINNIFSFTTYVGIILSIVFIIISFPISWFYNNSVYIPVGSLLAISVFFSTLNMIPNAILMKEKKFVLVAVRTITVYFISCIITIVLALCGWKYYALVAQSIISSVITFSWNYISVKLNLKWKFQFSSVKKILGYSSYNFGYDLLNYFGRNLDNLLTGKTMGTIALGYYNKAYQLMLYPIHYLTNVITPVLHPILSDYKNNKQFIYEKYIGVFKVLSLIGVFITGYCIFAAKEIVLILYGEKWIDIIPCVIILSGSIWFQMVTSTCTAIFRSLGNSKLRFRSGLVYTIIQSSMIILGVLYKDIVILSMFVSFSFIIRFFVDYYYLISRAFKFSLIRFYSLILPEILIGLILSMTMYISNKVLVENILLSAIYKLGVSLLGFIIGVIITKQYVYLLNIIPKKIRKRYFKNLEENKEIIIG